MGHGILSASAFNVDLWGMVSPQLLYNRPQLCAFVDFWALLSKDFLHESGPRSSR